MADHLEKIQGALFLMNVFILILFIKCAFIGAACWLWCSYEIKVLKVLRAYNERPTHCTLYGGVNIFLVLIIIFIMVAQSNPLLSFIASILLIALGVMVVIGYSAGYAALALQIEDRAAISRPSLRCLLKSGIIIESTFLLPILGQLLSLKMLFRGVGALILALVKREPE